jgi:hypothetical protein
MKRSTHTIELSPLAVAFIRAAMFADEPTQADRDRVRRAVAARITSAACELRRIESCRQN